MILKHNSYVFSHILAHVYFIKRLKRKWNTSSWGVKCEIIECVFCGAGIRSGNRMGQYIIIDLYRIRFCSARRRKKEYISRSSLWFGGLAAGRPHAILGAWLGLDSQSTNHFSFQKASEKTEVRSETDPVSKKASVLALRVAARM